MSNASKWWSKANPFHGGDYDISKATKSIFKNPLKAWDNATTRAGNALSQGYGTMGAIGSFFIPNASAAGNQIYNMQPSSKVATKKTTPSNGPINDNGNNGDPGNLKLPVSGTDRNGNTMDDLAAKREQYLKNYALTKAQQDQANAEFDTTYNENMTDAQARGKEIGKVFDEARGDLGNSYVQTGGQIAGNYSARGLTDSSFNLKAQAQNDQTFNKNLSALNEDEASQIKELDDYLKGLEKQYQANQKSIKLNDFTSNQDFLSAMDELNKAQTEITGRRQALRDYVNQYAGRFSQPVTTLKGAGDYQTEINSIINSTFPANEKKTALTNTFVQMGRKNPERDANAYTDYFKLISTVQNSQDPVQAAAQADSILASKYNGWRPFGSQGA